MNSDSLSGLLLIIALILLRGLIVLAYNAFANVRQSVLRDMADEGHRGARRLLPLLEKNSDLEVSHETSTTLLSIAIAAVSILGFANPLMTQLDPSASPLAVYVGVLLVVALLTLIFGELVPQGIGSAYASSMALSLTGFMQILITLLKPLTVIVIAISKAIATLFKSSEKVNTVTEEEIVTLVESGQAGGSIEEEEKDMILSVLQLDETYASEVMVPRIDITALPIDISLEEALASFISSGFSRIPLYENTIDNIKGLLYAKDLLSHWYNGNKEKSLTPRDLMRQAYFVPETKRADDLLKELQTKRVHMAVVIDEFGGTAGIVTIENIIEEIIGDIQDEHDPFEEAEYVQESETEYSVDASMDIDDFNDLLDVEVPGDDSDTLGGFVYTTLGRVPVIGEEIKFEDHHKRLVIRVEKVEGRRIRKVRVYIHDLDEDGKEPVKTDTSETTAVAETTEADAKPVTPAPTPSVPASAPIAAALVTPAVTSPADAPVTAPTSGAVPVTPAEAEALDQTAEAAEVSGTPAPLPEVPSTPAEAEVIPAEPVTTEPVPASPEDKTVIPVSDTKTETKPEADKTDTAPSSDAVPVTPPENAQTAKNEIPPAEASAPVTAAEPGDPAKPVEPAKPAATAPDAKPAAPSAGTATKAEASKPSGDSAKNGTVQNVEDGTQPDKPRQPISEH